MNAELSPVGSAPPEATGQITPANYTAYKNLPPLAGLATFEQACQPGLLVEACVARWKRIHYCLKRLHELFTARLTAEPIYELKMAFAHHAYLCAEHVQAIRQRVSEMREPPLGLDDEPDEGLVQFFDELLALPSTGLLIHGVYQVALPALEEACARYDRDTNPLTDAPSRRCLRFLRLELKDLIHYGEQAMAALLTTPEDQTLAMQVADELRQLIRSIGSLDGTRPINRNEARPPRRFSATPFQYDPKPQRDERFTDLWNQGVNAEAFLYNEDYPPQAKVLMMLFKRLREIDVPEMMASIITQTRGKPWTYYRDMSRQLWDEARHAMMGEVGFVSLGVDWTLARITYNWSYRLNTECTPLERHAVLFFIEQGLMPKTGKRFEYETALRSGLPLAATIQDFDWADEVLHSQNGRQWYVAEFGSLQKALEFGDQAWSKILSNWITVKEQGLTAHENWWPRLYTAACQANGQSPDPAVLAYATSYDGRRADLQTV